MMTPTQRRRIMSGCLTKDVTVEIDLDEMIEHLEDLGYNVFDPNDSEEPQWVSEDIEAHVEKMYWEYVTKKQISEQQLSKLFDMVIGKIT